MRGTRQVGEQADGRKAAPEGKGARPGDRGMGEERPAEYSLRRDGHYALTGRVPTSQQGFVVTLCLGAAPHPYLARCHFDSSH